MTDLTVEAKLPLNPSDKPPPKGDNSKATNNPHDSQDSQPSPLSSSSSSSSSLSSSSSSSSSSPPSQSSSSPSPSPSQSSSSLPSQSPSQSSSPPSPSSQPSSSPQSSPESSSQSSSSASDSSSSSSQSSSLLFPNLNSGSNLNLNEQQNSDNINQSTIGGTPSNANNGNDNNRNDDTNNISDKISGQTTLSPPFATITVSATPTSSTPTTTTTTSNNTDTNPNSHGSVNVLAIILPIIAILLLAGLFFYLKKKRGLNHQIFKRYNPAYNHNTHRRLHDIAEWSQTNSYIGEVEEVSIPPTVQLSRTFNKRISSDEELEQSFNASSFYNIRFDERTASSRDTSGGLSSYSSEIKTPNETRIYLEAAGLGQISKNHNTQFQNTEQILTEPDQILIIDHYTSQKRPENPFNDDYSFDDEVLDIVTSTSGDKYVNWGECMK